MYSDPILSFTLFGKEFGVYLYGVCIAVGILAAFAFLYLIGKKRGVSEEMFDFIFYNGIVAIVIGFLGATLYQAFYNYLKNPAGGFQFGSGMTFIGGLIFGAASFLIGYFLVRKRMKSRLIDVECIFPSCILLAHGFGRIGCFFAGCCYGADAKGAFAFLGVSFPEYSLANYHGGEMFYDGTPVYPTMLFEAAFLFILFGVCTFLLLKKNFRLTFPVYLISYAVFRFLIEYVRGDERGKFILSFLSPSQFQSVLMLGLGIALIFVLPKFYEKRAAELETK